MISYEAELTWEPTANCYGWRWVTWRLEDGERDVVACGDGNYSSREDALELAHEAAKEDRSRRVFDRFTGKSYNVHFGINLGTKGREIVPLEVPERTFSR